MVWQKLIKSTIITSASASHRLAGKNITDEEVEALYIKLGLDKTSNIEHLLSTKQLALWHWASQNGSRQFSRKDAVEALGFPERTIESIIKKLLTMKRLERLGEGTATRYRVVP